jgi:hypothetical protein
MDEELARWNLGGDGDPNFSSNRANFHPAPRVLVDVGIRTGAIPKRSKSKGVLSEASLVAQARNAGYWPFRLCFEEGLRRDPSLRGKTRVRFTVESSGHVRSEKMAFSELKDQSVGKCLAARTRALHFSPAPSRRVHADITIDLNPGDAPLPDWRPSGAGPEAGAKLDESGAARALSDRLGKVTECYSNGLARDPKLWGRLAILLDIDAEGRVLSASEHDSRFPDRSVSACVLDTLRGAQLPKPEGTPARLVWAVRLGTPPTPETTGGKAGTAATPKRTVAESVPPRVPVAK